MENVDGSKIYNIVPDAFKRDDEELRKFEKDERLRVGKGEI